MQQLTGMISGLETATILSLSVAGSRLAEDGVVEVMTPSTFQKNSEMANIMEVKVQIQSYQLQRILRQTIQLKVICPFMVEMAMTKSQEPTRQ